MHLRTPASAAAAAGLLFLSTIVRGGKESDFDQIEINLSSDGPSSSSSSVSVSGKADENEGDCKTRSVGNDDIDDTCKADKKIVNEEEEIRNYLLRLDPRGGGHRSAPAKKAIINRQWPGSSLYQYSRLVGSTFRQPYNEETFDYIIVGGGGVGCPLARTLAERGYKTLLIERGGLRENHFLTWTKETISVSANDENIAQPIVTTDGVITHVANVLGGGTAVNYGIYIEEDDTFTESLGFNVTMFNQAQEWVRKRVAHSTDRLDPKYAHGVRHFFEQLSRNFNFGGLSPKLIPGTTWEGYTLFDTNGFRTSADVLLGKVGVDVPKQLTVATNTKATKVEFREDNQGRKIATCVQTRRALPTDHAPVLGKRKSSVNTFDNYFNFRSWLEWYPRISKIADTLLGPRGVKDPAGTNRVCLGWRDPYGEIILSAGAIMSPWLLYQSGVGPAETISRMGNIPLVANVSELGRNLGDRPFVPLGYFHDKEEHRSQSLVRSISLTNVSYADLLMESNGKRSNSMMMNAAGINVAETSPTLDAEFLKSVLEEAEAEAEFDDDDADNSMLTVEDSSSDAELLGLQVVLGLESIMKQSKTPLGNSAEEMIKQMEDENEDESEGEPGYKSSDVIGDRQIPTGSGVFSQAELDSVFAHRPPSKSRTALVQGRSIERAEKIAGLDTQNLAGAAAFEEVSGGKFAEGVLGQRTFVPPSFRTSVFLDLAMEFAMQCAAKKGVRDTPLPYFKGTILGTLCPIMDPVLSCLDRSAAQIWLLPKPQARGFIGVGGPDGRSMTVTANYLRHPDDLANAAKGMGWMIQKMNSTAAFDGLLEKWDSPDANIMTERCPLIVRSKLAVILNRVAELLQTFIPTAGFNRLEQAINDDHTEVGVDQLRREVIKLVMDESRYAQNKTLDPTSNEGGELQRQKAIEGLVVQLENSKYLSFPPLLPSPLKPRDVARFVKRTVSSMWHWHGSAALGRVTDPETFEVMPDRFGRLSIVDASVIPTLTRLNPQAFLMALGRYAGELKADRRKQRAG